MAEPIWKDYTVTLAATASNYPDGLVYRIQYNNNGTYETIFQGRAYPRPGQTALTTRINDICADYLGHYFPLEGTIEGRYRGTFKVGIYTSAWADVATVEFLNDWSYEPGFSPANSGLAFPIDGWLDPRQLLIQSRYSGNSVTATINFNNGNSITVTVSVGQSADFNNDFSDDFALLAKDYDGAAILKMPSLVNVRSITMGGITYPVYQDTCARYVLYYINAYGGWDSYVIRGRVSGVDSLTRHERRVEYDNADTVARGRETYALEIGRAFTFRTGWLTDDQAGRMHHLLESTAVYMHDLLEGVVRPLVLTGSDYHRRSYAENQHKPVYYEITAALAQDRIRR